MTMNDSITKKDLIEVVGVLKKDFIEILDDRLAKERVFTGQKFDEAEKREKERFTEILKIMNTASESLDRGINKLEGDHDRRITIVEDRIRVIKNVIEKDLHKKVAW